MSIEVVCQSCGFVLYRGAPKNLIDVLRKFGFRCPCCLSPLSHKPITFKVTSLESEENEEGKQP